VPPLLFRYRNRRQGTNTISPLVPDKYNIVTDKCCATPMKMNVTYFSIKYNTKGCSKHIRVRYWRIAASDGAISRDQMGKTGGTNRRQTESLLRSCKVRTPLAAIRSCIRCRKCCSRNSASMRAQSNARTVKKLFL